jgi:hypothetical protein
MFGSRFNAEAMSKEKETDILAAVAIEVRWEVLLEALVLLASHAWSICEEPMHRSSPSGGPLGHSHFYSVAD